MSEKATAASDIRNKEKAQALGALLSTMAPHGDIHRYQELNASLSRYSLDLLGGEDILKKFVERGISRSKGNPFRVLVLGAGTGRMAGELMRETGSPKNLFITELGIGDPRTVEEKAYDEKHNIEFIQGNISTVKLDKSSYDLVLSRMFMLHMIDPLRVIKKVSRCMKSGGEFYADFKFTSDFVPRFRTSRNKSSEEQANNVLMAARQKGVVLFVDDTGLYFRKNKGKLKFENVSYSKDKKGRIYYKSL